MKDLDVRTKLYIVLCGIFLTALLVADITAGKFFTMGGREISVGVIPFPITFILTDVVNEYYGRRGARFLTGMGMAMLVFGFLIIFLARELPASATSPVPQQAFMAVFGLSFSFFAASLVAYFIGQLTDIYLFGVYKRLTKSRMIWLRATGSTAVSQVIDTVVVNFAALIPAGLALPVIAKITMWSYIYKMSVAVALTPLVYVAHWLITDKLRIAEAPEEEALTSAEPAIATHPK